MTRRQEKTMRMVAEKITPTKNLHGAKRLKRVVREKLIRIQEQEKKALVDKLAKAAADNEQDLQRQEQEELDALNRGNHDPAEHAKLVLLRRQDIAYLRLRSIENGRLQRGQEFCRHDTMRREKLADLTEWFIEKKTGIDQTVISDQMVQLYETNSRSLKLLDARLHDQLDEEIKMLKENHEKNWDGTAQEELVEMKKLDLNYQQVVKEDLEGNDSTKKEILNRNLAAYRRVKIAEMKLKEAPPNEVHAITENLGRYEKVAQEALERDLASTRRRLTKFEDILCSQRGVTDDSDSLRSLFKREVTAVKEKLVARKKRDLERLVRQTSSQLYLAKREHSISRDGNEQELNEEISHIKEHQSHMETNIAADYKKQIEGAETRERARQAANLANQVLFWEELAELKIKHDIDFVDLKADLQNLKDQARLSLGEESRKQQQQLETSLNEIGTPKAKPSGSDLMTPGTKIAKTSTIQSAIVEHDSEVDRLYFTLEMNHRANYDRAVSSEKARQETCEGLEDDFEARLAKLKESHESEISLLSDSLFAEQRRQRDRLKNRLSNRKKKRRGELEESNASDSEIDNAMQLLDLAYEEDEGRLLKVTGDDIEHRVKVLRDHYTEEEKKLEDFSARMAQIKSDHDKSFNEMKKNMEADQRRLKQLLKRRLAAKRAKKEADANGMSEASQELLKKEEEETMKEFEYHCSTVIEKVTNESKLRLNADISRLRGDMNASDEFFLSLHGDIEKIRKEHSESISFLEAELELKGARARRSLQNKLQRARAKRTAKATEAGGNMEEVVKELGKEHMSMEDDLEKSLVEEELSRKEELSKKYQEEREATLKSAAQISNLQQDQIDEARKLQEEAMAAGKRLEAEMRRLRLEKENRLKEKLAARKKKKESDLRKKGASSEERKAVEAVLLEEEVAAKEQLEEEIEGERRRLEVLRKEEENARMAKLREAEEEAAKNAEKEAEFAKERALHEMERLKREHEEGAYKRQEEMEAKRDAKKRKLKKQLEKRKKKREKDLKEEAERMEQELEEKRASDEEKEKARKLLEEEAERARVAAKEESKRLTAELEAALEIEKQKEEEERKIEGMRQQVRGGERSDERRLE